MQIAPKLVHIAWWAFIATVTSLGNIKKNK